MSMTPEQVTMRALTLPLGGGRLLRLALTYDAAGQPEDVVLACGWPGRRTLDLAGGLSLPSSCVPELTAALASLST